MRYKIISDYYDGRDSDHEFKGFVRAEDLNAFVVYLKACGFVGRFKKNKGCYCRELDPGWLDHHGNHIHTIKIIPYKEPKTLTPNDWNNMIESFNESNYYEQISPGYYRWKDIESEDDEEDIEEYLRKELGQSLIDYI
ncbi:hypothetical protein J5491_01040 [Candidatus Saccharibacteria bacterium]|nr:hypothetical protein [Candidatus Saccharibacteria bacterium]